MLDVVQRWNEEVARAADSSLWPLTDHDLLDSVQGIYRLQQVLGALQVRLVREVAGRDLPGGLGFRSVEGWLRESYRMDLGPARELAKAAVALRDRPVLEQALIDGQVDIRQAAVIAAAVNALPAALSDALGDDPGDLPADPDSETSENSDHADGPDLTVQAESKLIELAGQLPAYYLRQAGDRILSHIAPEIAERVDEAALRRTEARAKRRRHLTLSLPADGTVRVSGLLSAEDAAVVRAALDPLCHPLPDDQRSAGQRRADALVDVCAQALRTGDLPTDGGERPQLAVTISFDPLRASLGKGLLPDGERVSASTARRMACDAKILPFVLGGESQILDAGRSRRLATVALRRGLNVRDGGCAFPGCDRTARRCDAHHIRSWTDGGPTDLDNLVLLCRYHHGRIHEPAGGWRIILGADRHPDFIPPPWIDPQQLPQRNLFHQRA